jgi:hypothetical protein
MLHPPLEAHPMALYFFMPPDFIMPPARILSCLQVTLGLNGFN